MASRYQFESLDSARHNRATFSCGVDALDRYLQRQARQDLATGVAAVFVLRDTKEDLIAGYYTLSSYTVSATSLPPEITKKLPRYPQLPAILIGRLANDQRYRGQGIGSALLVDALRRIVKTTADIAAIGVVVDAKDNNARQFYEHHEFLAFLDDEYKLFLPMGTAARLIAKIEPELPR